MDKSLIALFLLLPSLALAQTHTMPGSNVVPSGATLTIQSGGTINAAAGSTVTGFGAGGGAPTTATYITQTADAGLSAEVALSTLATGLLKSTTTTGALTTVTAPSGTVVGTTDTQTLSAKTIGDKLDITSVSTPATPSSGTARLYAGSVLGVDALGYLNSLGVPVVLGRDVIFLAKNVTGATIVKGCPVYIVSASSATPNIAKAQSEATLAKLPAAGFTAHDIANNATGMVLVKGVLNNVNTSAQADGASLYVGTTAGTYTSTRPTHPNPTQEIGLVEDSNATTGSILVNCGPSLVARQDGVNGASWAIGDSTGTTKSYLVKNAAGTGTLSWNPSTNRTLTLPDSTGTLYVSGGTDVAIADGGTGASTLPSGLLVGAGTSAITALPAGTAGYTVRSDGTGFASYPQDMINSSTSSQSISTSDVYLAGSNCVVAAGDFKAKGQYRCVFDMTKTAGTGAIAIAVRTGPNGTTADNGPVIFTFGAGTSVADTGNFEVIVTWRSVGSGTSAVIQAICRAQHNLATTGLFNNAVAWTIVGTTSIGFNSNANTNIGLSFNGGTAFAGTTTLVQAQLLQ